MYLHIHEMWTFNMRYYLLLYYYGLFLQNLEKGWSREAAPVCFLLLPHKSD